MLNGCYSVGINQNYQFCIIFSLSDIRKVIIALSQVDRPSTSVNGDIAIQWEWSNFDSSQNQNPLTDYDKTLHN